LTPGILGPSSPTKLEKNQKYKSDKGQGWGALAKSLGIKPGSREFHALKRGHDLYDEKPGYKSKGKGKGKSKK